MIFLNQHKIFSIIILSAFLFASDLLVVSTDDGIILPDMENRRLQFSDSLTNPDGMDFHEGTLYIADRDNNRIVAVDGPDAENFRTYGQSGQGIGQFSQPADVKVDKKGRIYIADYGNDRIVRISDMNGGDWQEYGGFGTESGRFYGPSCIALYKGIYVVDKYNQRVVYVKNMNGKSWEQIGINSGIDLPLGTFVDGKGRLFIFDYHRARILMYDDPNEDDYEIFRWPFRFDEGFQTPYMAVENDGKLLFTDTRGSRIVSLRIKDG